MIRPATVQDAPDIAALWNDLIAHTTVTFTSTPKTSADITALIGDTARAVLVADHEGGFAGFGLLGPFRSGPGYAHTVEHTIYIQPDARGNGIGATLMSALEQAAGARGHHQMIGAISGTNADAIAFHETMGFAHVGKIAQAGRKNGQWLDLVLMQKFVHTTP